MARVRFNEKYEYEILDNGYDIYIDGRLTITQHDQYSNIYKPNGTFEENAIAQITDLVEGEKQANMFENMKSAVEAGTLSKELFEQITGMKYDDVVSGEA